MYNSFTQHLKRDVFAAKTIKYNDNDTPDFRLILEETRNIWNFEKHIKAQLFDSRTKEVHVLLRMA